MNKKMKYLGAVLTLALIMTGCQSGGEDLVKKDYKALDYVELGEYTGLEVEQVEEKKELTEDEKEEAVRGALEEYAEEEDITDRAAQNGDYLSITYTCKLNGELVDETGDEPVEIELGTYTYFDEDGEKQLIGTKAGDSRTITITEDDGEDQYTYTYEVNVQRVYQVVLPELNDELAKKNDYDSAEAMKTAIYEETLTTANEEYQSAAGDELIQTVIGSSNTTGYPQTLYDKTYGQMNSAYQDFFGMTLEDIYEGDEDTLKEAVVETLAQQLVVEAIAEKEKIRVTQKELDEYKAAVADMYGYGDISELEAEYDDTVMIDSLLNEKVQDFLLSKAKVTYVTEEEYYGTGEDDTGYVSDLAPEDLSEDVVDDVSPEDEEI